MTLKVHHVRGIDSIGTRSHPQKQNTQGLWAWFQGKSPWLGPEGEATRSWTIQEIYMQILRGKLTESEG